MSRRMAYLKNNGYVSDEGVMKYTKVTNFCIPMFGVCAKDFGDSLINAHISHNGNEHNFYIIVLKDKIHNNKNNTELVTRLSEHKDFVESFDDDEGKELVFKFKIPQEHHDDYYKILSGSYSKISDEYKTVLEKFYGKKVYPLNEKPLILNGQVATTMWEILNPSIKKKEIIAKHLNVDISSVVELISKPDLRYELYQSTNELYNQENQL